MTMDAWDREIKPCLHGVESDARWVAYYAASARRRVQVLGSRPDWETRAQAGLADAERELTRALEAIRAARHEYDAKPVAA